MWKILLALLLALLLVCMLPIQTTALTRSKIEQRCISLTTNINAYRTHDLKIRYVICKVGAQRSRQQAERGQMFHDLNPLKKALANANICWRSIGEVLAWNNYKGSGAVFVNQWKNSPTHWNLLSDESFDLGGGAWVNRNGNHYATYYVVNKC